jgi:hypothetical protein
MDWYQAPNIYIEITVEKMMQPELIGRALLIILAGIIILVFCILRISGLFELQEGCFVYNRVKQRMQKHSGLSLSL